MADHQKFLALATRLIKKHGRLVAFNKLAEGGDPDRPWGDNEMPPVPLGSYMGCMVPFRGNDFGSSWADFDLSKVADNILLVAGVPGVELADAEILIDGGKDFKIEWVQVLKPADLTILYAFGVNR